MISGPQFETIENASPKENISEHIMSRLNWMTYLKVLYDKLSLYKPKESRGVSPDDILDAVLQIQKLLPIVPKKEYEVNSPTERGMSLREVEVTILNLGKEQSEICWDDIIDVFLSAKLNCQEEIQNQSSDDLVKVLQSEGLEESSFKEVSDILELSLLNRKPLEKIQETSLKKPHRQSIIDESYEFSPNRENTTGAQQFEIYRQKLANPGTKKIELDSGISSSPELGDIVKKIEFNDSSESRIRQDANDQNESRTTFINQNCSFQLSPSSRSCSPSQGKPRIQEVQVEQEYLVSHEFQPSSTKYSSKVFDYKAPYESNFSMHSPVIPKCRNKIISPTDLVDSNKVDLYSNSNVSYGYSPSSVSYYDIDCSNMKATSSLQVMSKSLEMGLSDLIKKDKNQHLRGVNLSKNFMSRVFLLNPMQTKQLIILNMSWNYIQNLNGIEACVNLQFVNLQHNMIVDITPLNSLSNLQEVYLSHNFISYLSTGSNNYKSVPEIVWPEMQILDLTFNKLNDFEELMQIVKGYMFDRSTLKLIALKGNEFFNFQSNNISALNLDLEVTDIIEIFSQYKNIIELHKLCFDYNKTQYFERIKAGNAQTFIIQEEYDSPIQKKVSQIRRLSKSRISPKRSLGRDNAQKLSARSQRSISQLYSSMDSRNLKGVYSQKSVKETQQNYMCDSYLSRNVKFFDLQFKPIQEVNDNKNSYSQTSQSISRSQLNFSNCLTNIQTQQRSNQAQYQFQQKRSILNNKLQKSIDLTLNLHPNYQPQRNESKKSISSKHNQSNSFSFTSQLNKLHQSKFMCRQVSNQKCVENNTEGFKRELYKTEQSQKPSAIAKSLKPQESGLNQVKTPKTTNKVTQIQLSSRENKENLQKKVQQIQPKKGIQEKSKKQIQPKNSSKQKK